MDETKIRILAMPFGVSGHINPMLALVTALKERNHKVIVAIEKEWQGKFLKFGFEEIIITNETPSNQGEVKFSGQGKHPAQIWIENMSASFGVDPYETMPKLAEAFGDLFEKMTTTNTQVDIVIKQVKPDLILYDQHVWHPAVPGSGVPFIHFMPANPLTALEGESIPPSYFGLSLDTSFDVLEKCKQRKAEAFEATWKKYAAFVQSVGGPMPPRNSFRYLSSNLNIYLYPRSLARDYQEKSINGKSWIGIDHAIRPVDNEYSIPEDFKKLPGKLVFLSMGTLGSSYVQLMKKLVDFGSKAKPKYKFIVSKGKSADQYELADNMIGEAYLPQLGVLPLVDLAIIHGGNNSFVETVYFGKPMIVCPLFFDQHDNAQRAIDAKIGSKFNPFTQTGEELISLMDQVLESEEILSNVDKLSKEVRERNSILEVVERIEIVAKSPKTPTFVA